MEFSLNQSWSCLNTSTIIHTFDFRAPPYNISFHITDPFSPLNRDHQEKRFFVSMNAKPLTEGTYEVPEVCASLMVDRSNTYL